MSLAFLDKYKRKKEIKRLENIKAEYLKEYEQLCAKYKAQLVPLLVPIGKGKYQLTQQLDLYTPITQEEIDKIAEAANKQTEKSDEKPQEKND